MYVQNKFLVHLLEVFLACCSLQTLHPPMFYGMGGCKIDNVYTDTITVNLFSCVAFGEIREIFIAYYASLTYNNFVNSFRSKE